MGTYRILGLSFSEVTVDAVGVVLVVAIVVVDEVPSAAGLSADGAAAASNMSMRSFIWDSMRYISAHGSSPNHAISVALKRTDSAKIIRFHVTLPPQSH
ncbi:hypothetical protein Pelo_19428 [Pelomyxa schiedti]|nr:hypothetical protein Pelo_19428 [Pelomyxa schiedti]